MASNFISVLFNLLASFCGWGSFAISIAAVVVADWTRREVLDLRYGLFERCTISTDECEPIPDITVEHWGYAVRAFTIMMIIFGFFGGCTNIGSFVKVKVRSLRVTAMGHFIVAGCCGIIGVAIFTYNKENNFDLRIYGSAYIMAWTSTWGFYLSALLQSVAACTAPKYDIH